MPSVQTETVTFHSDSEKHRLVIPGYQKDYEFVHGRIMGETKGHTIEFENHLKVTSDPVEIDYLRERISKGDPKLREMAVQVPDPSPILAELATSTADRTREILSAEREGWGREVIIETCERKLASMPGRPRKDAS
jgi:hypothetical protein